MIDPIDGTRDFIDGDADWAIHIGLCIAARPALGVVVEPAHGRVLWGIVGQGAFIRDAAGTRSLVRPPASEPWRFVASKSHRTTRLDALADALGIPPTNRLQMSSVGCKVSALVRNQADIYIHDADGTKSWDTCAPQALLEAVQGTLTDLLGHPLDYTPTRAANPRGILATLGLDHNALGRIQKLARGYFP
jgi:3'(2'), 5'-bisphosphate nucleotidase